MYLDIGKGAELERLERMAALARVPFQALSLLDEPSGPSSDAFTAHVTVAKLSQLLKRKAKRPRGMAKAKPLRKLPQVQPG